MNITHNKLLTRLVIYKKTLLKSYKLEMTISPLQYQKEVNKAFQYFVKLKIVLIISNIIKNGEEKLT